MEDFDKMTKEISEELDYPIEGVKKFFDEVGKNMIGFGIPKNEVLDLLRNLIRQGKN